MKIRGLLLKKHILHQVRYASTKPFYVTTPIFYVNGKPHLGHLYSMVLCDIRNRWEKLTPFRSSFFLTGTDEHGLKVQTAAESEGVDTKKFVDKVSSNFKILAEKLNIDFDRFIRTTDEDHIHTVHNFWNIMMEKGLIYEGKYSGWYSVSDETFYPESQIEQTQNAKGEQIMISSETRNEVKKLEEMNYCFKLSQFRDQLIEFLESRPDFIVPRSKYNELLTELKSSPLADLSVSRPSSRLKWGIEVPNDSSQKIYVWFDALINYITAAGFPSNFEKKNGQFATPDDHIWPATHVIGKDIIRFHCIYWPIFLMAANIDLPQQVIVHSHWLSESFKMSKSLGNVVDPIETLNYYGEDALRFYLAEYSNIDSDCNFVESNFYSMREKLIGKYANLMTRAGGPSFNIEKSVNYYTEGKYQSVDAISLEFNLSSVPVKEIKSHIKNYITALDNLHDVMNSKLLEFDMMRAVQSWWSVIEKANQVFQSAEPWTYTKAISHANNAQEKEAYSILQNYFVYLAAEGCRITSILASPIIPSLAANILDRLSIDSSRRNFNYCKFGADKQYGKDANKKGHKIPIQRVPMRKKN